MPVESSHSTYRIIKSIKASQTEGQNWFSFWYEFERIRCGCAISTELSNSRMSASFRLLFTNGSVSNEQLRRLARFNYLSHPRTIIGCVRILDRFVSTNTDEALGL
jgi:hypothetical protein